MTQFSRPSSHSWRYGRWHHGVSIAHWQLDNFKSVQHANITFSPLTLLVGANSAGKSTLLQSILAVTQAVNAVGDRFPLNGGTVRLGTVTQNRYAGPSDEPPQQIAIGAEFRVGPDSHPYYPTAFHKQRMLRDLEHVTRVDWSVSLGDSPANQSGSAMIEKLQVKVSHHGDERPDMPDDAFSDALLMVEGKSAESNVARPGRARRFGGKYRNASGTQDVTDVLLRGGLPTGGWVLQPLAEVLWSSWRDAYLMVARHISNQRGTQPDQLEFAPALERAVADIVAVAKTHAEEHEAGIDFGSAIRSDLLERYVGSTSKMIDANLLVTPDFASAVIARLETEGLTGQTQTRDELEDVSGPVQQILDFLRHRVRYLGPLREDPRVVYQDSPEAGNGYVGAKGEYCAAVLQNSGSVRAQLPFPELGPGETRIGSLSQAVNAWAAYLEIGTSVRTTDQGRLGLEVQVAQEYVDIPLDLTSVGTGVSQILPVLVMCLQAPPGSLLMMEQPELHLNPRVQQRLADFLLAMAASGRQLIVETHSEYLISRLRLRVAEDSTDEVRQTVGLLFAERIDGATLYRQVETNEYGGLDNWPANFFDQSAEESRRILRAAVNKRRAQQHDPDDPMP